MATKTTKMITAEEFVRAWQKAENFAAFCAATGAWPSSARTRAALLRAKGIPLKKFPRGRPPTTLDVDALRALALRLAPRKAA